MLYMFKRLDYFLVIVFLGFLMFVFQNEKKVCTKIKRSVLYRLHTADLYHGSSTQKPFKDPPKHILHA